MAAAAAITIGTLAPLNMLRAQPSDDPLIHFRPNTNVVYYMPGLIDYSSKTNITYYKVVPLPREERTSDPIVMFSFDVSKKGKATVINGTDDGIILSATPGLEGLSNGPASIHLSYGGAFASMSLNDSSQEGMDKLMVEIDKCKGLDKVEYADDPRIARREGLMAVAGVLMAVVGGFYGYFKRKEEAGK